MFLRLPTSDAHHMAYQWDGFGGNTAGRTRPERKAHGGTIDPFRSAANNELQHGTVAIDMVRIVSSITAVRVVITGSIQSPETSATTHTMSSSRDKKSHREHQHSKSASCDVDSRARSWFGRKCQQSRAIPTSKRLLALRNLHPITLAAASRNAVLRMSVIMGAGTSLLDLVPGSMGMGMGVCEWTV